MRRLKLTATLREFLEGSPLTFPIPNERGKLIATQAVYRVGDGVYLERDGVDVGKARVITDADAARLYHNLRRDLA